jgi:hypothetical protein
MGPPGAFPVGRGGVGTEPEQQLAWGALGFARWHPPRGRAPLGGAPQPAGPGSERGGAGSPIWPGLPLVGPGCVPGKPPALFRVKDHQGGYMPSVRRNHTSGINVPLDLDLFGS